MKDPSRLLDTNPLLAGAMGLVLVAAIIAAACTGGGKATVTVPTPAGPAIVDLWWCEEGQCVVADDPANTPDGAQILASGVELDPLFLLPKSTD